MDNAESLPCSLTAFTPRSFSRAFAFKKVPEKLKKTLPLKINEWVYTGLVRFRCSIFGELKKTAPKTHLPIKSKGKHGKNRAKTHRGAFFGAVFGSHVFF